MFYKEDYGFELALYAMSPKVVDHIRQKMITQIERVIKASKTKGEDAAHVVTFTPVDLSYTWTINLELGVETLAIYHEDLTTPIVIVDKVTPWKDEPHHKHMAEFVNHHLGKSKKVQREHGAEFIIRALDAISLEALENEKAEIRGHNSTLSAQRALSHIDVGKVQE